MNIFRYILSFFQTSEPELSLEEVTEILLENAACTEDPFKSGLLETQQQYADMKKNLFNVDYNFSTETGTISRKNGENYIIDDKYEFKADGMEWQIGQNVSYHKLVSEGNIVIYNINPIENGWDTVVQKDSILSTRIMISKVQTRDKRLLFLTPGDITVDLDKVSTDFVPYVGDWLQLDVKYQVNEQSLDLSGQVIEVNKLSPIRPHIESGKILSWDVSSCTGSISSKIFFDKQSLSCGYSPVVGDKVVTEIIESDQGKCTWRALKVIPDTMMKKMENINGPESVKLKENHPGLDISTCQITFNKLGETQKLIISITNTSEDLFKLLNVQISRECSQLSFVKESPKDINILPQGNFDLVLSCTAKTMGCSNELLELHFDGFTIGRYVNMVVNPYRVGEYYQKNNSNINYNNSYKSDKLIVRAPYNSVVRFKAVRMPSYAVPKKLLELLIKYDGTNDMTELREELKIFKRCLFTDLTPMNYEDKFHTLLHLDEISNLLSIRQFDQERACFIKNGEFLMLEINNLAERRPSIVLGDKIVARDPLGKSSHEYEGNVLKVGGKHIYLKFSSMFHDGYNGEDYSVRVIPGRSSYRRKHHAIFLAARNLGKELIFPNKIVEKEPQVNFIYQCYSKHAENNRRILINNPTSPLTQTPDNRNVTNTENLTNNVTPITPENSMIESLSSSKTMSASQLIRKAREAKMRSIRERNSRKSTSGSETSESDSVNGNGSRFVHEDGRLVQDMLDKHLKLEWYNRHLNCKQKDAVINILKGISRPLPYIIFGPPGTGKTVTVIEAILQIIRLIPNCRLLVTAPSNSAADLLALRLIDFGVLKPGDLVRLVSINYAIGDRIPPKLVPYCATGSIAKESTADENIIGQNGMTFDCSRAVLGRHKITVSTCNSVGVLHMMNFPRGHFTHIFVDEAGQGSEPEVIIPLSFLDKVNGQVVLAGDPMQLGPVICSKISLETGLSESLLERLTNRFPYARDVQGFPDSEGYDPRLVTKLLHNYRSLGLILSLFSEMFYHGELIPTISSTHSPESLLLKSLASILPKTKDGSVPSIVFHGIEGENYQTADSPSWYNPHEAAQVFYYINECYRLGLNASNIGIITPYTKQVMEIRSLLREAELDIPKCGTVEEFQGQEFDIIFLSTVRSSSDYVAHDLTHSLGFVSSPHRLNVAISRPKALLIIIGNPALLCQDTYWRTVINYCVDKGAYMGCNF
ncbi:probable RNA helicase armi [Anthonomus grandis grandis]|uniref:probable RNA helicase armi n=1 Tax=Anthonomus grandis grandis TaxID=2921223 RepID=UPI0021661419|nr:probable RNA helicase armi [Anthonomus grandis grandis]